MRHSMRNRNYNGQPLNDDQLRCLAPSVFAKNPWEGSATHKGMSDKYMFVPTIEVVEKLRSEGLNPVQAMQKNCRIEGKGNFTKHIIRFDIPSAKDWSISDSKPEIVLCNSHDGSSIYQINAGVFRMVCSNGLIVMAHDFGSYKTRHTGNIMGEVLEATFRVIEDVPKIEAKVDQFQSIMLNDDQQRRYVEAALGLRWIEDAPLDPRQLLTTRRGADRGQSLWMTYQVAQENLIQGGLRPFGGGRRVRGVNSPIVDHKLNQDLWALTEKTAELVG